MRYITVLEELSPCKEKWISEDKPVGGITQRGAHAFAIYFAEWLQKNRWYTFENGKWHYTHEHGSVVSKQMKEKYYTKTTAQLLAKFMVSLSDQAPPPPTGDNKKGED